MGKIRPRAYIKMENKIKDICTIDFDDETIGVLEINLAGCPYRKQWDFDQVELMYPTGLKDRNGTDIYEGDVVMCWGGESCQGYWEFNDTVKVDSLTNPQTMSILGESENTEVIGNIFENPELLEGKPNG